MLTFIPVKEAAQRTGKSASSIRRILYKILETEGHPDRIHIEPSPEEVIALRMKGENFAWKISEELLHREIPANEPQPKAATPTKLEVDAGSAALIAMLHRELEIKNQQITAQNDLMKGLSERLREGNILIGSLQQQLALTDGKGSAKPTEVVAVAPTPKAEPTPPKRKGFFQRLFADA